jgi:Na+(H+)/acetate symporter ActP
MTGSPLAGTALLAAAVATVAIGAYGLRFSRTTSDFLVTSRSVGAQWNAAAISCEYLSAASFLGVAGLIAKYGADALWYPVGFKAGYLGLLLFVAAPLRRSGAYAAPDFAEFRLGSARLRKVAMLIVVVICVFYLVPQYQGAGLALKTPLGVPVWIGPLVVGGIVVANVVAGGMRSITFVQAFQYWLKMTAIAIPALTLLGLFFTDPNWAVPCHRRSSRIGPSQSRRTWWSRSPNRMWSGSRPAAGSAAAIRSIRCCRSWAQRSWEPWVYRMRWCASTPIRVSRITVVVLGILANGQNIAFLVALAFAVAAAANLPTILYSLYWPRLNTRGALWSMYGGLVSTIVLIIFSPAVSGAKAAMLPSVDFAWFPLANPGIVSIPLAFILGVVGTLTSPDRGDPEINAEFEVRALTVGHQE